MQVKAKWCKLTGSYNVNYSKGLTSAMKTYLLLGLSLLMLLTACSKPPTDVPEPAAPSLTFADNEMTVSVGDVITLGLTRGESEVELTFASSDESIATVTPDGTVTAIAEGTVVITSYMGDIAATLKITVVTPRTIEIVLKRNVYSLGETVEFDIVKAPGDDTPYSVSVFLAEIADDVPREVLGNSFVVDRAGLHTVELVSENISTRIQLIVFDLEEFAREIFILTNTEREKNGLHPLEHDENLDRAAEIRAVELVDLFSHTRPDGSLFANAFLEAGVTAGSWAENLASGQRMPEEAIEHWMASDSHRDAILNEDHVYLGVGVHMDDTGKTYWVQTFR